MSEVQGVHLGLKEYIERRKKAGASDEGDGYAFSGDLKVMRTIRRAKPVEYAVAASVRLFNSIVQNQLLGGAVRVTAKQFPYIHKIGLQCAEILGVPEQEIYIIQGLGSINVMTLGTNEESVVIVNSATVDHLTEQELHFVIGHEFGHIQNNHVVYKTSLYMLLNMVSAFVQWIVQPAILALNHWSRRGEITADRAGLLCCKDLDVAQWAMAKIALGSKELYSQLNLDEYLKQLEEGRKQASRVVEVMQSHPYIPKRIEAMRLFSESEFYRRHLGLEGGMSKAALDEKVGDIIKVL